MTSPQTAVVMRERTSASRILVFGGILLILGGMLLGEVFAIFISHVGSAQIRREWIAIVPAIARHDSRAVSAGFDRIQGLLERRGRIMDTHSHIIAYGFVALTLALLQRGSKYSDRVGRWLAIALVVGGVMQAMAVFVSYYRGGVTFAVSDAGAALVLVGVLGNILGLWGAESHGDFSEEIGLMLRSASSRILLRTGAFLILLGMLFGFYYAWVFVTRHEPAQMLLLGHAVNLAESGDTAAATDSVIAYRGLQSRIAIVTAAHSHVIEMGIMAMLLAFVQDFVFLSDRWKRRWAILFSIGAAAMPICTYCASIFGLVPVGFADAFGLVSVIALFAMLFGLVRYTGAIDQEDAA